MNRTIYFFMFLLFFSIRSFAYDADDRPGGTATSGSSTTRGTSTASTSTGRADRDQQGGGAVSTGTTSTGRADRDQQGSSVTSSSSTGGRTSTSPSSSSSSSNDNDDSSQGSIANAFSSRYGSSTPSTASGTNLSYGPNVRSSVVSSTGSSSSVSAYTMGVNVPVNSTTVSASEGGYDSRGNFYSTGRTVSSSGAAVVNSMLMGLGAMTGTTEMVQSFANGLQRVATRVGTSAARVAQQASRVISVNVAASTAGVVSMNNSIRGTIGAGGLGYQEAVEAAYYRGVAAYYNAQGIPAAARIVPTGPMARAYGMAAVASNPTMAAIDEAFNRGSVSVVSRRTGTSEQQMREFLGAELYDNLTDTQRLATQRSVLVAGTISGTSAAPILDAGVLGEYDSNQSGEYTYDGYVVVDVAGSSSGDTYSTIMRHELQHAGDWEAYELARNVLDDESSTDRQRSLAEQVIERLEPVVQQEAYASTMRAANAALGNISTAQIMRIAQQYEYLNRLSEVRAYAVDPTNMEGWAVQFSELTGVPLQEARQLISRASITEAINTPLSPENTLSREFMRQGANP